MVRLGGELRDALAEARSLCQAKAVPPVEHVAAPDPRARVEAYLRDRGYDEVRMLGNRQSDAEGSGMQRLSISARKGGILYKGFALLDRGDVTRTELRPTYGVFP